MFACDEVMIVGLTIVPCFKGARLLHRAMSPADLKRKDTWEKYLVFPVFLSLSYGDCLLVSVSSTP